MSASLLLLGILLAIMAGVLRPRAFLVPASIPLSNLVPPG
jgi:hypothetical protein